MLNKINFNLRKMPGEKKLMILYFILFLYIRKFVCFYFGFHKLRKVVISYFCILHVKIFFLKYLINNYNCSIHLFGDILSSVY